MRNYLIREINENDYKAVAAVYNYFESNILSPECNSIRIDVVNQPPENTLLFLEKPWFF